MEARLALIAVLVTLTTSELFHLTTVTILQQGINLQCKVEHCHEWSNLSCILRHFDVHSFMIGYNRTHLLSCYLRGDQHTIDISNFNGYLYIKSGKYNKPHHYKRKLVVLEFQKGTEFESLFVVEMILYNS